jgi:hypothetical protein
VADLSLLSGIGMMPLMDDLWLLILLQPDVGHLDIVGAAAIENMQVCKESALSDLRSKPSMLYAYNHSRGGASSARFI